MAENTTTSTRTGTVRATYTGAITKTVTITQSAGQAIVYAGDLFIEDKHIVPYFQSAEYLSGKYPDQYVITHVTAVTLYSYMNNVNSLGLPRGYWGIYGYKNMPKVVYTNPKNILVNDTDLRFVESEEVDLVVGIVDNNGIMNYLYYGIDATLS